MLQLGATEIEEEEEEEDKEDSIIIKFMKKYCVWNVLKTLLKSK
jgi:hypothetical protein